MTGKSLYLIAAPILALALSAAVSAQPADLPIAPATTKTYPPGVRIIKTPGGSVYADARGRVLYGMDMRTLLRAGPDPSQYCQKDCTDTWEPVLAPADAQPNIAFPRGNFGQTPPQGMVHPQKAPDWTVIAGPQGPQWVYKGWHMVFTRRGDAKGSTVHDGEGDHTWNTLKFVPPVPDVSAPGGVAPVFVDGAYALADRQGRVLFTGKCGKDCANWAPLAGGMASSGFGEWRVIRTGDTPQWTWRGKPVFVSQEDDPTRPPPGGHPVRP